MPTGLDNGQRRERSLLRSYTDSCSRFGLRSSTVGRVRSPGKGVGMKTIQWNRRAVEQAKAQRFDDPRLAICPGCGTTPAIRQFGRYQCECGELEGFAMESR